MPRERAGSFEPQLIGRHERRFTGFDDKIIFMYARGVTVRDIQGFLAEMYSVDVSAELISSVTDEVMSAVMAGQSRPLEAMYYRKHRGRKVLDESLQRPQDQGL